MRNEAMNVEEVVKSATQQEGISDFSILVLDDQSTDETYALLSKQSDPRIKVFQGEDLPEGWLGRTLQLTKSLRKLMQTS